MKKKDIEKTLSDAVFAVMPTDMFENIEKRLDPEKERIVTMKVYKYGDNVDTDVIIPARYLNAPDEKSLACHCMEAVSYTHLPSGRSRPARSVTSCSRARWSCPAVLRSWVKKKSKRPISACKEEGEECKS